MVNALADLSLKKNSPDGSYRVPLTLLARCSRGGKTRALLELAKGLREEKKIPTVFVSFNDFSDCDGEISRGDSSLDMLCRRIAFDARPPSFRSASIAEDFEDFKEYSVPDSAMSAWLGDHQVVLLIDELNGVELDRDIVHFLKKNFCQREGRYYVFSSHLSSTNPEGAVPSNSFRDMRVAGLPLIQDLSGARDKLDIGELTPRLALYYGLIPALLVTSLTVQGLADVRQVDRRVKKACGDMEMDFALFQKVLYSFFTGEAMESDLDVLLDASNAKNYWIPCYLMRLLKRLGVGIGGRFGLGLRDIAADTEGWSTCKEGSGDGWESLFLLVLWLRFASGRTDDVECIPSIMISAEEVSTRLFYNYPFPSEFSIAKAENIQQLQYALDRIRVRHQWVGGFPKVSIYYPKLSNFAEYDVFVCLWLIDENTGAVSYDLHGYQLKEGKEIPGQQATLPNSYLVRRHPAIKPSERRGWECLDKPSLKAFFGVSGERWLPEKWRGLSES